MHALFFLFFGISYGSFQATLDVSKTEVGVFEPFALTLTIVSDKKIDETMFTRTSFPIRGLEFFFVKQTSHEYTQQVYSSSQNIYQKYSVIVRFILVPKKAGTYTIWGNTLTIDGVPLSLNTITVKVNERSVSWSVDVPLWKEQDLFFFEEDTSLFDIPDVFDFFGWNEDAFEYNIKPNTEKIPSIPQEKHSFIEKTLSFLFVVPLSFFFPHIFDTDFFSAKVIGLLFFLSFLYITFIYGIFLGIRKIVFFMKKNNIQKNKSSFDSWNEVVKKNIEMWEIFSEKEVNEIKFLLQEKNVFQDKMFLEKVQKMLFLYLASYYKIPCSRGYTLQELSQKVRDHEHTLQRCIALLEKWKYSSTLSREEQEECMDCIEYILGFVEDRITQWCIHQLTYWGYDRKGG